MYGDIPVSKNNIEKQNEYEVQNKNSWQLRSTSIKIWGAILCSNERQLQKLKITQLAMFISIFHIKYRDKIKNKITKDVVRTRDIGYIIKN